MRLPVLLIGVASVAGLLLSLYATLQNAGVVEGSFCNISETFSCDLVNKGPYSKLFGISVARLGLIGYGFLLVAAVAKWRAMQDRGISWFLFLTASAGLGFSLYLTYLEAFVLRAWCIICLGSLAAMAITWMVSVILLVGERKSFPAP